MKKIIYAVAAALLSLSLASCGENTSAAAADEAVKEEISSSLSPAEDNELPSSSSWAAISEETASADADVDLTVLSSTMVYSEVFNIMVTPDDYIGKRVKMQGALSVFDLPETGKTYYACVIADATACCQRGLEFVLTDESQALPDIGEEITVTGEFEVYEEDGLMYCHLINAYLG